MIPKTLIQKGLDFEAFSLYNTTAGWKAMARVTHKTDLASIRRDSFPSRGRVIFCHPESETGAERSQLMGQGGRSASISTHDETWPAARMLSLGASIRSLNTFPRGTSTVSCFQSDCVCVCMYVCIHTCIHTCIYTHTHMCIHIYLFLVFKGVFIVVS